MTGQDSQHTIKELYNLLDFQAGENLATADTQPEKIYEKVLFEAAYQKLGVESVFFYQPPNGGTSVPYLYFRRLEGQNAIEAAVEIAELHKLAWNMGRAPLLLAALPNGQVLIYNTYFPPSEPQPNQEYQTGLIYSLNIFSASESERRELLAYRRQEFESGRYWQQNSQRFELRTRADQTLLENLIVMRQELIKQLSTDVSLEIASRITHSLLGRTIFIKYLEDRRDSFGKNVFPDKFFEEYKKKASCFADVLSDKEATYNLFQYLNDKFNGDIFPVKDVEYKYITDKHLGQLKLFLTGEAELSTGQLSLWKFYSFDVIPIEFISNIYEEFFHIQQDKTENSNPQKNGTHYTPPHLVEFLVDEVFPWEGTETAFRTLDPACGSGIFLVEVYRRLIAHWYQANKDKHITYNQLKELLTKNIFGVDLDSEAIRVAAFSLYLTLCDFLEPRQIWKDVKFPKLRHKNLFPIDFFEKEQKFTNETYDLIIGNPPWQSKLSPAAEQYREDAQTRFPERQVAPDNQIALAFLWRAVEFCKPSGEICFLMPSKGLLFNRSTTHRAFRRQFISTFHVKTIINFSASRRILFEKAIGPGSAIFYTPRQPDEFIPILYCTPKPSHSIEDNWQITIESQDIAQLSRTEIEKNDIIWKTAMWGGPRDYELIKKLMAPPYQTLEEICKLRGWTNGEGITVGNKKNDASWFLEKPYVGTRKLQRFVMDEDKLPLFTIPKLENTRNKTKAIFYGPHILLKQSPLAGEAGFRAALLKDVAIFRHSLIGINGNADQINLLSKYCLILNSRIPLYFALMSSRRWLVERDELEKEEIMSFPMPEISFNSEISYETLKELAQDVEWENKIKSLVEKLYVLTEDERILIEDAINYTLDYFRLKAKSNAAKPTFNKSDGESFLEEYLKVAKRTLENSFGERFEPIIFQGSTPLRVVALKLVDHTENSNQSIIIENSNLSLNQALSKVNEFLLEQHSQSVFVRRNARAYIGNTTYIIKPDQRRYWTRANALRDADEVYADIMEAWRP